MPLDGPKLDRSFWQQVLILLCIPTELQIYQQHWENNTHIHVFLVSCLFVMTECVFIDASTYVWYILNILLYKKLHLKVVVHSLKVLW